MWKQNEGGDTPGCSERPWQCLFLFTVTELLLNTLTMINSGLGLVSSACFFGHFFFSLPISQGTSLLFCWKTSPQKAEGAQRQPRRWTKQLPPCTAAWMGSKPFPGRRQGCRQGAAEQTQLLLKAVAFTGTPRRHKPVISALCKIPFGRLLPAELSHVPLGHPELPKPVYRGSTDLKAESPVSYKAKIHFRQTGRQRSITIFHLFIPIYFLKFFFFQLLKSVASWKLWWIYF